MNNDYEPSAGQVCREMIASCGNSLAKGKNFTKDLVVNATSMTFLVSISPYILPTSIRDWREFSPDPNYKPTLSENMGGGLGIVAGLGSIVAQVSFYGYAIKHDHPEALALPVATNVLSLGYELFSSQYKKAKQRLVEKHQRLIGSSSLEEGLVSLVEAETVDRSKIKQ